MKHIKIIVGFASAVFSMLFSLQGGAAIIDDLTNAEGYYTGPSVEERIVMMDTDKNGFVDVFEVRKFLEKQHGVGYKKALLDRLELNAMPNSCGTNFVDQLVTNE